MPTAKVTLYHSAYQNALELDVGVLGKLLQSNRAAQSCTKYFQRLDMACRCLRKKNLLQLFADYQSLTRNVSETVERTKKQKKREEVFWDFAPKVGKKTENDAQHLIERLMDIRESVEKGIPEAVARLEYASKALFQEMARGFFLSFCSVAVASVARIRVLLQNLGSQILYEWPAWQKHLVDTFGKPVQSALAWDAVAMKELQHCFNPAKGESPVAKKHADQARELLLELGCVVESNEASIKRETPQKDSGKSASAAAGLSLTSRDDDLGERMSSHAGSAIAEKEIEIDYMDTAIKQVQSNLALSKKSKMMMIDQKKRKIPPSAKQAAAKPASPIAEVARNNGHTDISDVETSADKPKKKKKRKDSSKPKSTTKKAKKSGDFFDNLFR